MHTLTIQQLLAEIEHVYETESFDVRRTRWNVIAYHVSNLFVTERVHTMPMHYGDFLRKIRDTIPSPQSLREFQPVFEEFKKTFFGSGVTTGRTNGTQQSTGNIPRSGNVINHDPNPGNVMLHFSVYEGVATHHTPHDCSPSDSGSSDCGGSSD